MLSNYEQLTLALQLITEHMSKIDKSGFPAFLHPIRVAMQFNTYEYKIAALLHDLIEDTDITLDQLIDMGFDQNVTVSLTWLTHKKNQPYDEYINGIIYASSFIKIPLHVKLVDVVDNMSRLHELRNKIPDADVDRMQDKYNRALRKLLAAVIDEGV